MSGKQPGIFRFCLWSLMVLPMALSAQNVKRGFKLLEKPDFEKSYELFRDALVANNKDVASLFGIALVYADTNSPYFNLVNAWENAGSASPLLDNLTPEEIEFIGEYFYNTEARHISRPVKKKIEYAIETIEAKLIKYIREENNLDLVYEVLNKFPDFRFYENVIHIRNQLEFRKYEKQNTLNGYIEFLKKFPDAAQVDKAVKYRNKIAFENAKELNTAEAYSDFIKNYPDALEYNSAVKGLHASAFQQAKKQNTIQAMDKFIADYPDALENSEARTIQRQLLYEYAKKIQTLAAYNEFIRKYPEGQQYIDIFNLKSLDKGMQLLGQNPLPSNNIQWARSFDEENNEELSFSMVSDTLGSMIIGGTVFRKDTANKDAWILKLSSDGKMIWNTYVGEEYDDEVHLLAITPANEILGTGLTWLGTDSSSFESWIFKLGNDGRKIWSKSLGSLKINTMLVSRAGTIYLGGSIKDDSLQLHYSIMVLNNEGRKLWNRTYTEKGDIVQLCETSDHQMLLVGNKWCAKISPKGYLKWETHFAATDSITNTFILPGGNICYFGFRNNITPVFIKTDPENKILFNKELTFEPGIAHFNTIINGSQYQLIALLSNNDQSYLSWLNAGNGTLINQISVPEALGINMILQDAGKNLILSGCKNGFLLIKNNGLVF